MYAADFYSTPLSRPSSYRLSVAPIVGVSISLQHNPIIGSFFVTKCCSVLEKVIHSTNESLFDIVPCRCRRLARDLAAAWLKDFLRIRRTHSETDFTPGYILSSVKRMSTKRTCF